MRSTYCDSCVAVRRRIGASARLDAQERALFRTRRSMLSIGFGLVIILRGILMADQSVNGAFQLNIPKELLSEAKRRQAKPNSEKLRIEGWRTSWLSRLSEKLIGKD